MRAIRAASGDSVENPKAFAVMVGTSRHPRPARVREIPMKVIKPLVMREGRGAASSALLLFGRGDADILMFGRRWLGECD